MRPEISLLSSISSFARTVPVEFIICSNSLVLATKAVTLKIGESPLPLLDFFSPDEQELKKKIIKINVFERSLKKVRFIGEIAIGVCFRRIGS